MIVPTLQAGYQEASAPFKAGTATSLSEMSHIIGKEYTTQKVIPILLELLKDENSEVKLNVVQGLVKIAEVIGTDLLNSNLLTTLSNMTKDG